MPRTCFQAFVRSRHIMTMSDTVPNLYLIHKFIGRPKLYRFSEFFATSNVFNGTLRDLAESHEKTSRMGHQNHEYTGCQPNPSSPARATGPSKKYLWSNRSTDVNIGALDDWPRDYNHAGDYSSQCEGQLSEIRSVVYFVSLLCKVVNMLMKCGSVFI